MVFPLVQIIIIALQYSTPDSYAKSTLHIPFPRQPRVECCKIATKEPLFCSLKIEEIVCGQTPGIIRWHQ